MLAACTASVCRMIGDGSTGVCEAVKRDCADGIVEAIGVEAGGGEVGMWDVVGRMLVGMLVLPLKVLGVVGDTFGGGDDGGVT